MGTRLSVAAGPLSRIRADVLIALISRERALFDEGGLAPLLLPVKKDFKDEKIKGERSVPLPSSFHTRMLMVMNVDAIKHHAFEEKVALAVSNALSAAAAKGFSRAALLFDLGRVYLEKAVTGALLGRYAFTKYKSRREESGLNLVFHVQERDREEVLRQASLLEKVLGCVNECRDLVNEPSLAATIEAITARAGAVARQNAFSMRVIRGGALAAAGFNGLLTVGKAGSTPPRMVILQYKPGRKADKHLCLVGKGIVFDSGGICLKPAQDMWTMKADMSGAAACLYAMKALALRKPAFPVTAILCLAENLPDSRAVKPGDIFRAANGKSVHVENTDAEGRLVLSDGLCMAGRLKATHIVDLATLTGACVVALGEKIAGLMGNNRGLIDKLMKASEITGESLWPLPLPEFYRENLDIYCADINNVGVNRNGGALNGGIFLKEFVPEGAAWAHVDIAGPAFFEKKWKYYAEGATGFGVRLLVELMKIL